MRGPLTELLLAAVVGTAATCFLVPGLPAETTRAGSGRTGRESTHIHLTVRHPHSDQVAFEAISSNPEIWERLRADIESGAAISPEAWNESHSGKSGKKDAEVVLPQIALVRRSGADGTTVEEIVSCMIEIDDTRILLSPRKTLEPGAGYQYIVRSRRDQQKSISLDYTHEVPAMAANEPSLR